MITFEDLKNCHNIETSLTKTVHNITLIANFFMKNYVYCNADNIKSVLLYKNEYEVNPCFDIFYDYLKKILCGKNIEPTMIVIFVVTSKGFPDFGIPDEYSINKKIDKYLRETISISIHGNVSNILGFYVATETNSNDYIFLNHATTVTKNQYIDYSYTLYEICSYGDDGNVIGKGHLNLTKYDIPDFRIVYHQLIDFMHSTHEQNIIHEAPTLPYISYNRIED